MGPHRADIKGPDGVIEIQRSHLNAASIREREEFYGRMMWILNGHDFWQNLVWLEPRNDFFRFRWKHRRVSWEEAKRKIMIDTPFGLFYVERIRDGVWYVLEGRFVSPHQVMRWIDKTQQVKPDPKWIAMDAQRAGWRTRLKCCADKFYEIQKDLLKIDKKGYPYIVFAKSEYQNEWHHVLPLSKPCWLRSPGIHEYLLSVDISEAEAEVLRWQAMLKIVLEYVEQCASIKAERLKIEAEIAAKQESERLRREEVSRRQYEAYLQRIEEENQARKRAAAMQASKDAAALYLAQAEILALEWRRPDFIDQFLAMRPAPAGGMGGFSTDEIIGFVSSLAAARERVAARAARLQ